VPFHPRSPADLILRTARRLRRLGDVPVGDCPACGDAVFADECVRLHGDCFHVGCALYHRNMPR
jgi:hypothetical protein